MIARGAPGRAARPCPSDGAGRNHPGFFVADEARALRAPLDIAERPYAGYPPVLAVRVCAIGGDSVMRPKSVSRPAGSPKLNLPRRPWHLLGRGGTRQRRREPNASPPAATTRKGPMRQMDDWSRSPDAQRAPAALRSGSGNALPLLRAGSVPLTTVR